MSVAKFGASSPPMPKDGPKVVRFADIKPE